MVLLLLLLFFNIIKGYQKMLQPVSTHAKYAIKWPCEGDLDQENTISPILDLVILLILEFKHTCMRTCISGV